MEKTRLKREQVAREREEERARKEAANRAAQRRMWSDEALDAAAEMETEDKAEETSAPQQELNNKTNQASSKASRLTTAIPATPSDAIPTPYLQPMQSAQGQRQMPALGNTSRRTDRVPLLSITPKPFKKKFKIGKGDELELSKSISFMTEVDEADKVDDLPEPHGFRLQDPAERPATAIQVHPTHLFSAPHSKPLASPRILCVSISQSRL